MSKDLENSDIGSDLCRLALLLQKHELCNDIAPLQIAGNACIYSATPTTWKYQLEKIVFTADEVGGRLACDSCDILISLSVIIEGYSPSTTNISNPLNQLKFDIEIDGQRINPTTDTIDNLYAAWHLDRHIFGTDHDNPDGKTKYSHPLYHFAFGGDKMEAKGHDIYGCALILPSPRLLYPPMDAVLGIDFILQNYLHKGKIEGLIQDPEYIQILLRSQERIWKPFFCSLYSHWDTTINTIEPDFTALKLMPLYY